MYNQKTFNIDRKDKPFISVTNLAVWAGANSYNGRDVEAVLNELGCPKTEYETIRVSVSQGKHGVRKCCLPEEVEKELHEIFTLVKTR